METTADVKKKYQVTGAQAGIILTVLTVLYMMNYADRSILSVVLQSMKVALGLTDAQAGIVQSVFSVGVGVLTIPVAWMVDRWSRRKSIGLMALIWSVATFATGLANRFIHLIFARLVVGVGEAGYSTGGSGWLSLVFPKERRGLITGIFGIGTVLGTALGLIIGGVVLTRTGSWQVPFYIFAVPGIIFGVWAFFLKDYATVKGEKEGAITRRYLIDWIKLFKIKSFTFTTLGQSCWAFYYFTFLGWLPAFVIRGYNLDAGAAGSIVGGVGLLAVVGSLVGGVIADRWQKKNRSGRGYMMALVQLLNFILLAIIVFIFGSAALPVVIVLLAMQMLVVSMVNPLIFSLITDISPVSHRMAGQGLMVTFVYAAGAALGPWVVGSISDAAGGGAAGLRAGFLWILPVLLAAVVFYSINSRYYADDSERVSDEVFAERTKT